MTELTQTTTAQKIEKDNSMPKETAAFLKILELGNHKS